MNAARHKIQAARTALVLDERPSGLEVVGGVLVVAGVIWSGRLPRVPDLAGTRRQRRRAASSAAQ